MRGPLRAAAGKVTFAYNKRSESPRGCSPVAITYGSASVLPAFCPLKGVEQLRHKPASEDWVTQQLFTEAP